MAHGDAQTIRSNVGLSGARSFHVTRRNAKREIRSVSIFVILLAALPWFGLPREVNIYRVRNFVNVWRGFWRAAVAQMFGIPTHVGALYAVKINKATGRAINYGLISLRVVTDVGVAFIVDAFQNTTELENMKYHGYGTGTTAEAASQTGLTTELTTQYAVDNTRPTGTTTEGASANIYRTVATLDPDADVTVAEHGVFSATSAGTLLDRSQFTGIALSGAGGDTLQTTYELTFTAGS